MYSKNDTWLVVGKIIKIIKDHKLLLLSIAYLSTRLFNLTLLPIFNDEAIYLDWGYREISTGDLFLSLFDGKQPLLMWFFGLTQLIIKDPLWAGRLVSVFFGLLTLIGLWLLTVKLFNKKIALLTGIFYITCPLMLFYDRQALMESSQAAIGVWSLYWLVRFYQTKHNLFALYLGITLGLGFFIKSTSLIFALSICFLAVILSRKQKSIDRRKWFVGIAMSGLVAIGILLPLLVQKEFWMSWAMNNRYTLDLSQIISLPFAIWRHNLTGLVEISFWQLTPWLTILGFVGAAFLIYQKKDKQSFLGVWILFNLLILLIINRNMSARYVMPFLPMLTITSAWVLELIYKSKPVIGVVIISIGLIANIFLSWRLIFQPLYFLKNLQQVTTYSQYESYVSNWTSGFAVLPALDYIQEITNGNKAFVGVRLDSGNPESAIFVYLNRNHKLLPVYFDGQLFQSVQKGIDCIASDIPFYYISRDRQMAGMDRFLQEIKRFAKPEDLSSIGIYQLKPNCEGNTFYIES